MLEQAQSQAVADNAAVVQITVRSGGASLRLKSWLSEYTNGSKPVMLADQELPSQVGATIAGPMRVLCIGPGDWLIVSHERAASHLCEYIEPYLPKSGLALVDLSDALTGLEIRGSAAREVLSKGCGLDFHPRSFPVGRCARTRFAQIPVTIGCLDQLSRFDLYVARSYVPYLHSWLTDAAVEFRDSLT